MTKKTRRREPVPVPRSPTLQQILSRSNAPAEYFSKFQFNGVGESRTYIGFTHRLSSES
jgi:hypothetical protein